jgi:lipopolysaccharide/colanic/teichoic acid biosynthesis glycosyltransferase
VTRRGARPRGEPPVAGDAIKRAFDVLVASSALVVVSPVLVVLWILVRRRLGPPAIFRQRRPGLNGRPFTLVKFRTMTGKLDASGSPLPDEARLTPFGRRLRSTSLDELPELWNVLRGDMSLVGPRPLLMQYLERYTPEQARRHEVRPGLTGWTQVNGRNALDWEQKFVLDVWYVDHRSFWLDLRILARTGKTLATREGISAPGVATAENFMGSDHRPDTPPELRREHASDASPGFGGRPPEGDS